MDRESKLARNHRESEPMATRHNLYVQLGAWKCTDAPIDPAYPLQVSEQTGAHYWIEMHGRFICKWCFQSRRFDTTPPYYTAFRAYPQDLLGDVDRAVKVG